MKFVTIMPFGKHKGKSIEYIAGADPSYIIWLKANTKLNIPEALYDRVVNYMMDDEKLKKLKKE